MKRCVTCNQLIAFGAYQDGDEQFCSLRCLTSSPLGTFCEQCLEQTGNESSGDTYLVNVIGSRLMGSGGRCATCHSIEQREWFWLIFPLVPLRRYRCIYASQTRFVSRRIPDEATAR